VLGGGPQGGGAMSGEATTVMAVPAPEAPGASGAGSAPPRRGVTADPAWRATAAAGLAMLAALVLVLARHALAAPAVAVVVAGVVIAAFVLVPRGLDAVHRRPGLLVVAGLLVVFALWLWAGVAGRPGDGYVAGPGASLARGLSDLGRSALWPLLLMVLTATGGLVLIADALRVRLGLVEARARRAPWQQMVDGRGGVGADGFPWRGVAGVLLVGWAAFLGIGVAGPHLSGHPSLMAFALLLALGGIAVVVGTPLLIAGLAQTEREDVGRARDADRQRFAAHLHDSVLQTLALVQRQAHDPGAVTRLARRQEHALRAWMAGETELLSETLVAALRDVVAEVEDEQGITIELSAIGDRPIDAAGEALTAAAREALRNAARHGGGARVFVFAELGAGRAEVFVRDEGPGFVLDDVPTERRGIRDAIVGRMAAVGGRATIDSAPGEGTEIALRLDGPAASGGRR
jgi:signal transduction histidine kinase